MKSPRAATRCRCSGDIPLFGKIFQEKNNTRTKRNLLVFVTPNIINQGYGTGLESQITGLKNTGNEFADPNGWRNNAKGAIRLKKSSDKPLAAEYAPPVSARGRTVVIQHGAGATGDYKGDAAAIRGRYKVNAAALE